MTATSLMLLFDFAQNVATLVLAMLGYTRIRPLISGCHRAIRVPAEGLFFGGMALITMMMPLVPEPGILLDSRTAMVVLSVAFGGPLSGLLTSAIAAAYRWRIGGIAAPAGIMTIVLAYAGSLAYRSWLRSAAGTLSYRHLLALGLIAGFAVLGASVALPSVTLATSAISHGASEVALMVPTTVIVLGSLVLRADERRALERSLAQSEAVPLQHQRALFDAVGGNWLFERPFLEAIRRLSEIAGKTLGVEWTAVYDVDLDENYVERLDRWSNSTTNPKPTDDQSALAVLKLAAQLDRDRVLAVEDVAVDARVLEVRTYLHSLNIRSIMGVPIYVGGRFRGVLGFSVIGRIRHWTVQEMNFARSVADLIALVLVTSRYREALAALDRSVDGIYVERENSRVIYANRAALEMAGMSAADTPQERPRGLASVAFPRPRDALEGKQDVHQMAMTIGLHRRELEIERSRLPDGGIIAVIQDVTRRNAAQRDRDRLQAQLQHTSKLEAIGQLAGGIAHDFNNLLGAMIGFARFLEQDLAVGSQSYQFARRILSAGERGKALVAQILAFARAQNVERRALDLRSAAREIRDLVSGVLPTSTRLSFDVVNVPMPIHANEGQITQVVVNLCINAHDALEDKPGTIAVRITFLPPGAAGRSVLPARISSGGAPQPHRLVMGRVIEGQAYARIEVTDTGTGILPDTLPRIFEPFFTTKERGRGTGLGLAVVHGIVSSYEGVVTVESAFGHGATFSVYLPLHDGAAEREPDRRRIDATELRGKERLLVVDDDADVTDMLSIGLERLGYEVAAVNDPVEALAAFRESPEAWDVVVSDQVMPRMKGVELIKQMRSLRRGLKVILCTGFDDGGTARSSSELALDAFFLKPVEAEQIALAVRKIFSH